jgi:hypothetical protein
MSDEQFYGWDAALGVHPTLVNLSQSGACGGGGCNASYANSQYWNMQAACSADVYARVLFQWSRYESARARLQRLMDNPPQSWVRDLYFADTKDAWGRSTSVPTPPAGQSMASKAGEWADWTLEVMRTIAVARWATNVAWCNGERTPNFYLGRTDRTRRVKATANWGDPSERDAAPSELGTAACARGRDPRTLDVASTDVAFGTYPPDEAWHRFAGWHPQGWFKPTSPRGASVSRWTWGPDVPRPAYGQFFVEQNAGICEMHPSGSSEALRAQARAAFGAMGIDYFDPYAPTDQADRQRYSPTILQFSKVLQLRRDTNGGSDYVMPARASDFDPVVAPSFATYGGGMYWPADVKPPSGGLREYLAALYRDERDPSASPADREAAARARSFGLNYQPQMGWFMPGPIRQVFWCMAHAYDVIDTTLGECVANAMNNFLVALNQIPEPYRTKVPQESIDAARAMTQANLDAAFGVASGVASGIAGIASAVSAAGPVGAVVGVVLYVVALLIEIGALLAKMAIDVGLARMESPPIIPQITLRSAGVQNDPTDPCWLASPTAPGSGGSAALVPKATAIRQAAVTTSDSSQWYDQVRQAIATGQQPPPPTTPQTNGIVAGVAAGLVGLLLAKLIFGGKSP